MPDTFELIEVHALPGTVLLRVKGPLDARSASVLQQRGIEVRASGRHLVLNLSDVTIIASSGLGALLALIEEFRPTGLQVRIAGLSTSVRAVIELLNLHQFMVIDDSEGAAMQALAA